MTDFVAILFDQDVDLHQDGSSMLGKIVGSV